MILWMDSWSTSQNWLAQRSTRLSKLANGLLFRRDDSPWRCPAHWKSRRNSRLAFYGAQATGPGEEPELAHGCAPTGERVRTFLLARRRPTVDHSHVLSGDGRHCGRGYPLSGTKETWPLTSARRSGSRSLVGPSCSRRALW